MFDHIGSVALSDFPDFYDYFYIILLCLCSKFSYVLSLLCIPFCWQMRIKTICDWQLFLFLFCSARPDYLSVENEFTSIQQDSFVDHGITKSKNRLGRAEGIWIPISCFTIVVYFSFLSYFQTRNRFDRFSVLCVSYSRKSVCFSRTCNKIVKLSDQFISYPLHVTKNG